MKTIIPYQLLPALKTLPVSPDIFIPLGEGRLPRIHRKLDVVLEATPVMPNISGARIKIVDNKPVAWLVSSFLEEQEDEREQSSYSLYTSLIAAVDAFRDDTMFCEGFSVSGRTPPE